MSVVYLCICVKQIDASNDPNLLFVFLYHNFLTSTDLELIVCEQRTKDSFLFVTATFPLIRIVRLTLIKEVVHLYHQIHHKQSYLSSHHQESKGSKNIKHLLFWIVRLTLIKEVVNLYPKPKIIIHHQPSAKERKTSSTSSYEQLGFFKDVVILFPATSTSFGYFPAL